MNVPLININDKYEFLEINILIRINANDCNAATKSYMMPPWVTYGVPITTIQYKDAVSGISIINGTSFVRCFWECTLNIYT